MENFWETFFGEDSPQTNSEGSRNGKFSIFWLGFFCNKKSFVQSFLWIQHRVVRSYIQVIFNQYQWIRLAALNVANIPFLNVKVVCYFLNLQTSVNCIEISGQIVVKISGYDCLAINGTTSGWEQTFFCVNCVVLAKLQVVKNECLFLNTYVRAAGEAKAEEWAKIKQSPTLFSSVTRILGHRERNSTKWGLIHGESWLVCQKKNPSSQNFL